jgi:hypothetical protein
MDKKMEQESNILDSSIAKTVVYSRDHTVDPTLVPSDDPRHEGRVIQGTLTKLFTNGNTVLFLFGGQEPGLTLQT